MSLESRKTNIFVIEKYTAPKLSLKIKYNFLRHRVLFFTLFEMGFFEPSVMGGGGGGGGVA